MDNISLNVIYALDLFGTASFAFSGALRALDRKPDIVGMLLLAAATAIGGSILRDTILDRAPVVFIDQGYSLVIVFSVLVTFFFPLSMLRNAHLFQYFDAVGFGIFSAITANYAWGIAHYHPISVVLIASLSGCAGGIVRDVIIQKPTIVLSNELYLTPVVLGVIGLMLVRYFLGFSEIAGFFTALIITITMRVGAIVNDWRLPRVFYVHTEEPPEFPSR